MRSKLALSESLGDYLESIYHIAELRGVARLKEIAQRMGVTRPSATGAVRALAREGLVEHDRYSFVTLSERGRTVARDLVRRHEVLRRFLAEVLGVPAASADRNACRLEHALDPRALERLVAFLERQDGRGTARREPRLTPAHVRNEGAR